MINLDKENLDENELESKLPKSFKTVFKYELFSLERKANSKDSF